MARSRRGCGSWCDRGVTSSPAAQVIAPDRDTDRRTGTLVRLVGPALDVVFGEGGGNAVDPRRGQVVRGSRQRVRGPDQAAGRIGEDLHVDPVVLLLPRVVWPVGGDTVDRQHGAVKDHVRLFPDVVMACLILANPGHLTSTAPRSPTESS
ncbi:hypothetical protein STPH2_1072 [Streptomyces sp. KO7888]|nr:hypothetical protein [Streptomyces sp. KO7888]